MVSGRTSIPESTDVVVIGGGFYGCCLALFLRSIYDKVVLFEAKKELLSRASFVNQARVHTGFHYPRSFVTAGRSLQLYQRFVADFKPAIVDDFQMLYAVARQGSRITPARFRKMFADMDAPIQPASAAQRALFDTSTTADVFACEELGFDATVLKDLLRSRLDAAGIMIHTSCPVEVVDTSDPGQVVTRLEGGSVCGSDLVFDATYGQFAATGGPLAPAARFKYELAEIALVEPPTELMGLGVTLMDGPFFSTMPFASKQAYSLTHVRYTPHRVWQSGTDGAAWPSLSAPPPSRWKHMQRDAMRYLPAMEQVQHLQSLFEVKTVLMRNEADDGRPILLARSPADARVMCVLGGKLDNIYDLFEALTALGGQFAKAHTGFVTADVADTGAKK